MALFISGALASGCITPVQRGPSPSEAPPAADLISRGDLEMKMTELNQMLGSGRLDAYQREIALRHLSLYEKMYQGKMECPDTLKLVLDHVNDLSDAFLKDTKGGDSLSHQFIRQFSEKRRQILDEYLYENYQGVIDGAIDLETSFGAEALTPEIGLVFAVSLAKKGMLKEALNIASKVLGKLDGKPDMLHLQAYMIDWELGLGKRDEALQVYEKLLDNLDERKALLSKAQRHLTIRKRDPAPGFDTPPSAHSTIGEVDAAVISFDQLVDEVERLLGENEYQQAKLLLVRRRVATGNDAEIAFLDRTYKRVEQAEAKFRGRFQEDPLKEDPLKIARAFIDTEEYGKAIEALEDLDTQGRISTEATQLKTLAIEGLINRERNRAAKLFLLAKNTQDPMKKKDYLLSSHGILKHLVKEYPLSPLNDKIKDNMETVEKEMSDLGFFPE